VTGWGETAHVRQIEQLARSVGLDTAYFAFTGPRFGAAKVECFREASAFVLPSHSEGLPMAVLEAWSYRLPALLTDQCNLPEGFSRNAAIRIDPTIASLVDGIRTLVRSSDTQLTQMGASARMLVAERYAWPRVAAAMRGVYEWVSGGGTPPGCVSTD
jgi:poly(glycerol-phosphate) alpha-glucosyltransferase